jgi:hypothetical protein
VPSTELGGIARRTGRTRFHIMDGKSTAQFLWCRPTATVERQLAHDESHLPMSLRVSEVTMLTTAQARATTVVSNCADLELGAHVVPMRTLASPTRGTCGGRAAIPPSTQRRFAKALEFV